MKKRIISIALVLLIMLSSGIICFANGNNSSDSNGDVYSIPVTLTVVKTAKHINVTLPAALPVSVLDGKVLTADNLRITNNSETVKVRISDIEITDGDYAVTSYANFPEEETGKIALWINGCGTEAAGALSITDEAFPVIDTESSLPLRYKAKVSESEEQNQSTAASVIFTLKAELD